MIQEPGSRPSPMNQEIRAFGKANTGHQFVGVPPIFDGNVCSQSHPLDRRFAAIRFVEPLEHFGGLD